MEEGCCTCTTLLSQYDSKTEKPRTQDRRLECCGRIICEDCIHKTPRFSTYCPFCQISTTPSPLPQGLRDPPAYTPSHTPLPEGSTNPPAYNDTLLPSYASLTSTQAPPSEKSSQQPAEDVLHFLDHQSDTLTSLSLRYGVPISALRRANNITSDHLLLARRTVIIPGELYKGGVSLSPRPIDGEEEERRKAIVRRFMIACKVAEYDVAVMYLEQANYDLDMAVEIYRDDDRWEREHPIESNGEAKGKTRLRWGEGDSLVRGLDDGHK